MCEREREMWFSGSFSCPIYLRIYLTDKVGEGTNKEMDLSHPTVFGFSISPREDGVG